MTRIGRAAALLALAGALILPASATTAGDGPTASKSGAIISYTSTAKLKIAKKMNIGFVCSVDCNVTAKAKIKGPAGKKLALPPLSASFPAGAPGLVQILPNKALLKAMKSRPGKFRVISSLTATDIATGAGETISRSFKVKR